MVNPVPGYKVTTPYKKRGHLWSLGWHTGDDFAAPTGTPIVSATPGKVIAANAFDKAYGYKVIIRWGDRDVWYCHMPRGTATVRVGQTVTAGQRIGKVGATGNTTGSHLHMELRVAGGGFAAANFRDPQTAINYTDQPDNDWFKVALVNFGAASAAIAKPGAKAKWLLRRKRLIKEALAVDADVIGGLECGAGAQWHYISTKLAEHGYALVPGGKEGRHLWRRKTTVGVPLVSGAIDTPRSLRLDDDNKPSPYMVAELGGSLGAVVLSHLEPRDKTGDTQVKQAKHIIVAAESTVAKSGVGPSRIIHVADTGSENRVRVEAFQAAKYGDAFDEAAKAVNKPIKSFNGYKKPVVGPRVDGIFVYVGDGPGKGDNHARPVRVVSQRLTTATDHHHQAAVIERQK